MFKQKSSNLNQRNKHIAPKAGDRVRRGAGGKEKGRMKMGTRLKLCELTKQLSKHIINNNKMV